MTKISSDKNKQNSSLLRAVGYGALLGFVWGVISAYIPFNLRISTYLAAGPIGEILRWTIFLPQRLAESIVPLMFGFEAVARTPVEAQYGEGFFMFGIFSAFPGLVVKGWVLLLVLIGYIALIVIVGILLGIVLALFISLLKRILHGRS